ncbi:MAG: iron-containing alcohol dehydrogenase [Pontiellaceae bacterium]
MINTISPFQLCTPKHLHIGTGTLAKLPTLADQLPTPIIILTGPRKTRHEPLWESLSSLSTHHLIPLENQGEPTADHLQTFTQIAREKGGRSVIAMGGGSAIDMGKALAAMLTNTHPLTSYLEIIGDGSPLDQPPAPMIAIPTTAGTGAEVTRNAVISIPEANIKVSLRHRSMIPDSVIVDPILTLSTPPNITAAAGLDALTQLIEAFCSIRSHPFTDALCRSGLTHLANALETAYHESDHLAARSTMAYAALLSGIALTHVGLGSVHGFAGPLGGRLGAAHGEICATLLPAAIQTNLQALHKRQPNHPAIEKYDEAAALILNQPNATHHHLCDWIQQTLIEMRIPTLKQAGLTPDQFMPTLQQAQQASSMKCNPIELTQNELYHLVEQEGAR